VTAAAARDRDGAAGVAVVRGILADGESGPRRLMPEDVLTGGEAAR
jgi:hypothetical protein